MTECFLLLDVNEYKLVNSQHLTSNIKISYMCICVQPVLHSVSATSRTQWNSIHTIKIKIVLPELITLWQHIILVTFFLAAIYSKKQKEDGARNKRNSWIRNAIKRLQGKRKQKEINVENLREYANAQHNFPVIREPIPRILNHLRKKIDIVAGPTNSQESNNKNSSSRCQWVLSKYQSSLHVSNH